MKLLVVEDNEDDLVLLEEWLSDGDLGPVDCSYAGSLREGLSKATSQRFDLVLLDLGLPDGIGVETFLRFQAGVPKQAILVLTGSLDTQDAIAAIKAGAQDCLVKGDLKGHTLARALRLANERRIILDRERMQASAIEAAANGIIVTDAQGTITFVNPAFSKLVAMTPDQLVGQTARAFKSGEHDPAVFEHLWTTISSGQVWRGRMVNKTPAGATVPTQLTITPVADDEGNILSYVGIYEDLTERERLENSLRQGEKLRAIGQLAGGVAHDFNNLLTVLVGHGEVALKQTEVSSDLHGHLSAILESCERASRLTSQLLAFGRRQMQCPTKVSVNTILTGMREMIERLIREDVRVQLDLGKDLWPSYLDVHLIEQVILNLSTNARDAMPDGGTMSIRTRNAEIDEELARLHPPMKAGDFVELTVSDTGCGMTDAIRDQVFEPFFTTKEVGKGTGLGLASVYGTVKQSEGFILVYSEVGHGTSFKIYFPRFAEEEEPAPRRPAATIGSAHRIERRRGVLLVEDDPDVRDILVDTLRVADAYDIVVAESGDDALAQLRRTSVQIDLLISDLVMPGLPVSELVQRMRSTNPDLGVLILSGYPHDMVERSGIDLTSCRFLEKPFKPSYLREVIAQVLA